jgi:hypothetical protein
LLFVQLHFAGKDKSFRKLYLIRAIFRVELLRLFYNGVIMKVTSLLNPVIFCLIIGLSSCTVQPSSGLETDDLYFSSEDRGKVAKEEKEAVQRETKVKETEPAKSDKNNYNFNSMP